MQADAPWARCPGITARRRRLLTESEMVMDSTLLVARSFAFVILVASMLVSRRVNGSSVANCPYWVGLGMLLLYTSYCLSGLGFANGTSVYAELILAMLVLTSALGFSLGAGRILSVRRHASSGRRLMPVPPVVHPRVSRRYAALVLVLTLVFFTVLTGGQPWRVLTDGVELKWERLQAASDKDAVMLLLDSAVFASILVGLSWSIIGHHDDRQSRNRLMIFILLSVLYVLSTGSRTPLIAVILNGIAAMTYGKSQSHFIRSVSANSKLIVSAAVAMVGFMIIVTSARIEFEGLSSAVFEIYFDIRELGVIGWLTDQGAVGFFTATLITYAASTFNNAVIRLQELDSITLSLGYKFAVFYITAFQKITGGLFNDSLATWRDLATINNEHLLAISPSATQWATLFGDVIWDFGLVLTFLLTFVAFYGAGVVVRRAACRPNLPNCLLSSTVISLFLLPLVNPFLSIHVHFMFFIIAAIYLTKRRRAARQPRVSPSIELPAGQLRVPPAGLV